MSRQFANTARFILLVLGITAVLTLTVHAAPTAQEAPRPRFNLEGIPHQSGSNNEQPAESALAVTSPNALLPWSKVAFQSLRNGNWNIFVGNDDGNGQTAIAKTGYAEIHPHLNRGNTKIVYAVNNGGDFEIYTMNVDGSGKTALTNNSTSDGNPSWSPDGSKIVFEAYRNGEADIYVMNANGSNQVRLTTDPDFDGMPAWSPDGSKIAFVSRRTGGYRIYVMNADGSGQTQISNQPYSFRPQWSPDGNQIAYDADNDGDGWQDLWRMNADGTNQALIYNPSGQTDAWASSWSPDGSRIVYTLISFIYYQGNWYWTTAYPDAWSSSQGVIRLSSNGLDWDASWQTSDITPPSSQVNALPSESPGPIPISWSASDSGGSGVSRYTIQVKIGNGSWQDWWTDVPNVSGNYPGIGGETYAFRVRARDNAFNYETWPIGEDASTTVESLAPSTYLTVLPEYSRYNHDLTVSWSGTDPGFSGIKNYDVQYKIGLNGSWVNWKTSTGQTTAVLSGGTAGETYYFRVRGTDKAENTESWPAENEYGQTTFYRWASYGHVFDNTHTPVSGASSTTIPTAASIVPSNNEGSYISYVLGSSPLYSADWSKPGYGSLPATNFLPDPDGYHTVILPPADNIIANWDFEIGATSPEWSSAGTLPQFITSTTPNTGAYSVGFGTPSATFTSNLSSFIGGNIWPQVIFGPNGEVIAFWSDVDGGNPDTVFSELLPDGTWSTPMIPPLDGMDSFGIAKTVIGPDGTLHMILVKSLTDSSPTKTDIYYTRRTPNKVWVQPIKIYHSDNPDGNSSSGMNLIVTDTGILHLVWREYMKIGYSTACGYDVFYTQRSLNGTWQTPINVSETCEVDFYDNIEIFEFQGEVNILWINDHDVLQKTRNPNGTWTDTAFVFSMGYHTQIFGAFMDHIGVLHLLISTVFTDPIYYINSHNDWSQPLQLAEGDDPRLVGDSNGNIHVVWQDTSTSEIIYTRRTVDRVWQTPTAIFEETYGYLDMSIDANDKVHLIWRGRPNGNDDIFYSWKDQADAWAVAKNISDSPLTVQNLQFSTDNFGNFHIFWQEYVVNSYREFVYFGPTYASQNENSMIIQEVTLLPSLANPVLSFMYQLGGVGPNGNSEFKVSLNDSNGEEVIFSTKQSTVGWKHQWVDVSAWAGETVTLTFELDQAANSPFAWAYLDEISLGSTFNDVWVGIESANAGLGETVPIVISYGNRGGALAENVEISLSLSSSLMFEGSDVPPTNATTPTWQVGDLPAKGATQTIVVYVRVKQSAESFTNLINSVSIETSSNELESLNNVVTGTLFTGRYIYLPIMSK